MSEVVVSQVWLWTNFFGLLALAACVAWGFRKRVGWIGSSLWTFLLWSSLCVFQAPFSIFPKIAHMLNISTGQAFSQTLLLPLAVLMLPGRKFRRHWRTFVTGLVLVELLLLVTLSYGLLNANSFDGGWIAAMLPVAHPWVIPLALPILFITRGATAWMVLGVMGVAGAWHFRNRFRPWVLPTFLATLPGLAYWSQGEKLFNPSGRVEVWARFFEWWHLNAENVPVIYGVGTGVGTYYWIAPFVQNFLGELYMQLHNDWLQILFEGGLVGLFLALGFYGKLLLRTRATPRLFLALLGLGALAVTYHPTHFFASALYTCLLIRACLEHRVESKEGA